MVEERKIFWKHWSGVLILAMVAGAVILLLVNLEEVIGAVQNKLSAYREQKQLEEMAKPYKNDKYGGATPEETFDLFIAALKKEDIDLASKYFVIPKQESWRKSLAELKKVNLFGAMLSEMEYARENSRKIMNNDEARFSYSLELNKKEFTLLPDGTKSYFQPGKYGAEIIFEKVIKVWKIKEI